MDTMEKVEKLRERANVSYEEAKNALDRANGDLLDAMIILEREGRTAGQTRESFSTGPAPEPAACTNGSGKKAKNCDGTGKWDAFCEKAKLILKKSTEIYLVLERKGEELVRLPLLAVVIIFLVMWYAAIIAMVVSLFFDCKYRFEGPVDLKAANDVCEKAGELAEQVKEKVVENSSDQ